MSTMDLEVDLTVVIYTCDLGYVICVRDTAHDPNHAGAK